MPVPSRPKMVIRVALLLALAAGCGKELVSGDLPPEIALRSDTPYISGRIVAREEGESGAALVRVEAPAGSEARVPLADVAVGPGTTVLHRDGRRATAADLRIGRMVTVWANGAELRKSPPQVTGGAVLIERWP
ncbi:MAG TPA: hypothetical protein VFS05_01575 [Gemmatimonadaceae bacterium]|nr:hypothetical protein [Gemmatimonadaceae bacterium]